MEKDKKNITEKESAQKPSNSLKERLRERLPDDLDISSIGSIDLFEAEQIATEEIVFLSEDDLIEGLEDFELIPIKNEDQYKVPDLISSDSDIKPKIRIKSITENEEKTVNEVEDQPVNESILFEDFQSSDSHSEEERSIAIPDPVKVSADSEPQDLFINDNDESHEIIDEELSEHDKIPQDNHDNIDEKLPKEDDEIYHVELTGNAEIAFEKEIEKTEIIHESEEDLTSLEIHDDEAILEKKSFSRITENSINIQLEEIFSQGTTIDDPLPSRFKNVESPRSVIFIDDIKTGQDASLQRIAYTEDPLTERLSRIIHVPDSTLSVITAKSDYFDEHAYLLEDTTLYDKSDTQFVDREDTFYGDPDLDFFENAIVKNDFSRFIQEIDDYYDTTESENLSQISEILGLNSEERELLENELFSAYYSNTDFESEVDFLNPDLDFIDRKFSGTADVNYLIDNPASLFEDEKKSIEDDITARSAIIFEEDVEDLKLLMERDYGEISVEKIIPAEEAEDIVPPAQNDLIESPPEEDEFSALDDEYFINDEIIARDMETSLKDDIVDITDRVIILEDRDIVNAFTSRYPDKKEDLVKLLAYLDGLFEKLPEEAIKKFAESEYFDLYVKVMNEIGA